MYLDIVRFSDFSVLADYAKKFGNSTIVASDFSESAIEKFNSEKEKFPDSNAKSGKEKSEKENHGKEKSVDSKVNFYSCKIIRGKKSDEIKKFKSKADFIIAEGGSLDMNAWAANQKGVDAIFQPFSSAQSSLDLSTANVMAQNNIFAIFPLEPFLSCSGFKRSQLMKNASFTLSVLEKAGVKILFVSGALDEKELRSARNLSSFGVLLGMKKANAISAVKSNAHEFFGKVK